MKSNEGITMVTLIITIIILLIIAGISVGAGNKIIKSSELENIKTNMLLIKVKGKEYIENANFKLGTNFDKLTDEEKENRVKTAKEELKGKEITDYNIFNQNMGITQDTITKDNSEYRYYYELSEADLKDMGISKVKSDEKNGWYIIKYDIPNVEIEVYNTQGIEKDGKQLYSLGEIQNLNIDL